MLVQKDTRRINRDTVSVSLWHEFHFAENKTFLNAWKRKEPKRERKKNKNCRRKKEIPSWIDECTTLRRKLKAEKTNVVDEKVGKSTRQRKNSNERTSNDNGKTAMRIIWRMWNETDYFRLNSSIFCRWAFFVFVLNESCLHFRSRRIMSSFSKRISRMTRWKHCCWVENEQEKEKKNRQRNPNKFD